MCSALFAAADRPITMTASGADILKLHEEKMDEFAHRLEVEVPETKTQLEQLSLVLRDEARLTDALANAVFKNHVMLRNASAKEKARKKHERGNDVVDKEHLVDDTEAYARIQDEAKEHKNYLRRLKGKTASKLTADERRSIERYIDERRAWIAEVESGEEYLAYVFEAQPVIDAYERETVRLQHYLLEENDELEQRALADAVKRQRVLLLPAPPAPAALVVHTPPQRAATTLDGCVVQSDSFSTIREIQAQYCQVAGVPDPTGILAARRQITNAGFCTTCHIEMLVDTKEATTTCPQCAVVTRHIDLSLRSVPFGEPINAPKSKGTYEKTTYKDKWMKMVSGELNNEIADEDWTTIFLECTRRRWTVVTRLMIRKLLKSLNMTHYYDNVPAITNELNDVPLIKFTDEEKATIDTMFDEAVALFDACPVEIKQRRNFISYSYFFYQACTMAGYHEYCQAFPLLCGKENLKRHDRIWKWMCEHKQGEPAWVFYPTV